MAHAMMLAAEEAGTDPEEIDQISVSANFSQELEHMEYHQLCRFFEKREAELMITPLKYLIGDFGGSGIIRAAAILLSLRHQEPLPVVDADILIGAPEDPVVWHTLRKGSPQTALMTSSTFGGGSSSMIFVS